MTRSDESRTELGAIRIHKNVIASIASLAANEVEGVKRTGVGCRNTLWEFVSSHSRLTIKVELGKNEEVKVEIPLVVKYGYNIPEVAASVQEGVRRGLEKMTDLSVKDININVQGVERG